MFREQPCGCIWSPVVGRVRFCAVHRLAQATGDGGVGVFPIKGATKLYPAHGEMPAGWHGK